MTNTFSTARFWSRFSAAVTAGINASAEEAAELARQRAPVRKVEPYVSTARRTFRVSGEVRTQRLRELSGPTQLKVPTPLTSRGRYELRSGRAAFTRPGGRATLGGRLRGEIHAVPSESGGPVWVAKVVSPTPYAKYVEFGTRHARSQPYLRPALAQVRESFRARMKAAARLGSVK